MQPPTFSQLSSANATMGLPFRQERSVPAWLPAPAPRQAKAAIRNDRATRSRSSIWITVEGDSMGEKLMLVLLVTAAMAGIGYGFASLIDFVQNWSVFNSWVGQIVH